MLMKIEIGKWGTYRENEQKKEITQVWILKTGFIHLFIYFFVCFLCHVMIVSRHEDFHF